MKQLFWDLFPILLYIGLASLFMWITGTTLEEMGVPPLSELP